MNWLKSRYVHFLIALATGNLLFFCFFYGKEYQEFSIRTEISCASPATVWYVYKEKFSQKRHFSTKKSLLPDQDYTYSFDIASNKEIEYIGLYWQVEQKSQLLVKSYAHKVMDKWVHVGERRNILDYASTGSRMEETKNGIEIYGKSGSNWVMLNSPENLNKTREIKIHYFLPVWGNIVIFCLALAYLLISPLPKLTFNLEASKWSRQKMLETVFSLWVFLMPFWIIISHTLMVLTVVLSLFFLFKEKRPASLYKDFKLYYLFYLFYLWIVISSAMVDSLDVTMKIAVDYSYFLLLPIAFSYIDKQALFRAFDVFEKGVSLYMVLLTIYVTFSYFESAPEASFFTFVEACVERFWHTSYLSMLLLLLFIKKLQKPLGNGFSLFIFYPLALLFMFIVDARMPFIVGIILWLLKLFLLLKVKNKKVLLTVFTLVGVIGCMTFLAVEGKMAQRILLKVTHTDARISLWKASIEQIEDNYLFGVGNESTQEVISQAVDSNKSTKFRNFNAHNQFLETALGHGIMAAIILICIFFDLFRRGGLYASCFVLTCLMLFMVESYLNRQAGMIIVTFWFCFFHSTDLNEKRN